MNNEEKIKVIESMGIDWEGWCPFTSKYKIGKVKDYNCEKLNFDCKQCWINALEK